jgi:hypothetical protein
MIYKYMTKNWSVRSAYGSPYIRSIDRFDDIKHKAVQPITLKSLIVGFRVCS